MRTPLSCSPLLLLLTAVAAPAQDPAAVVAAARDGAALAFCRDGDDVHGVGPDYLLRADADRVTFTPVLGAAAVRSVPLTLRLLGVQRGGEPLAITGPVRREHGAEVVYQHGAVRERYQLRVDGVEQTFVFDERPSGDGDLVVRLGVECVVAGVPDGDGGLRFVDPRAGGVRYGALLGVDARGATAAGTVQLLGDELQLRLPAAFVDAASYPLVFDPLLGTAALANSTADDGDPAVAFLPTPARWLVVWRRVVALGESHLLAQFVDPITSAGVPFVVAAAAGIDVSLPRVGACASAGSCAVAWRSATGVFGLLPSLRLRAVASSTSMGTVHQFSSDPRSVAIADSAPSTSMLPIVWADSVGTLHAIGVQFSGSASTGLVPGGTPDAGVAATCQIAISRHSAQPARYVVVWTGGSLAPNGIVGLVVDASGAPLGPAKALTGPVQARRLALDGDGSAFLLAWDDPSGQHVRPGQIVPTLAAFEPGMTGAAVDLHLGSDAICGDVAKVGGRYVVAYRRDLSLFETSSRLQVTDAAGAPIGPFAELVGPSRPGDYGRQGTARLAAIDALTGADDRLLAVFEEGQTTLPFDRDVVVQKFETMGAGGPVTTLAQSCGTGGITQTLGPCALGNSAFELRLLGGDPTATLALLSLAVQPVLVPCGPCTLLAPDVLEVLPISGGAAQRPFPIPLTNNLLGASFAAEWLPAFGVTGPCSLFPFLTTSTVIRVEVGL